MPRAYFLVNINREFLRNGLDIDDQNILDKAIEWIGKNMGPEDVFGPDVLTEWAEGNGFKRDEED